MHLLSLFLHQFRNYSHFEVNLHPHFNVIIGKNAQGKTNWVEAIHYLGTLQTFRSAEKTDLIMQGKTEATLGARLKRGEVIHDVRVLLTEHTRQIKLDGKKPDLFRDYYGLIPVLLFEPRDVYLMRETPAVRRRAIHRALFLDRPDSLHLIQDYEKVVAQKGKLLKNDHFSQDEMEVWDEKLLILGSELIVRRLNWINQVNSILSDEYNQVAKQSQTLCINYKPKNIPEIENQMEVKAIYEVLKTALIRSKPEEQQRRECVIGPHRDDWEMQIEGRHLSHQGSQGENRSAIIALKSAQVKLFHKEHFEPPLFILDDVASELDSDRVLALFDYLSQIKAQVFLTTTERETISRCLHEEGLSFLVEEGRPTMLNLMS